MDRTKIGNIAQGKRSSEIEKQLKRRVIFYLFAIVFVYGAWRVMRPKQAPAELTATQSIDALDTPVEPMPPAARIDSARLAPVRDETNAERAYLERDAQVHLLEQSAKLAYGALDQLGLQNGDWEQIAADPAGHRGKPY